MMNRRNFLRSSCAACAAAAVPAALTTALSSCSALPHLSADVAAHEARIDMSALPPEQTRFIVHCKDLPFYVLLSKPATAEGVYTALYLECTHESQPLTVTSTGIFCSSHGSAFTLEGAVTKEPAARALQKLPVRTDATTVYIDLRSIRS